MEIPGKPTGESSTIILKSTETKLEFYNSEFINKMILLLSFSLSYIYIIYFTHEN